MVIIIDGKAYRGTPSEIVHELIKLRWDADQINSVEDYIRLMQDTYRRMTGNPMELPEGSTEERIRAMFRALGAIGVISIVEEK